MSEPTDHELLADYARTGAEPAFGQLVARYINLVHSAARRHAGSEEPAEEITQAVFLILARKAGSLSKGGPRRHVALGGWLYQTARLTAANALKAETRRQLRDHQAYMQSQENQADAAVWREIAPLLDDAMGKLGETDRTVLVLRFFEGRTNAETAAALGLAEGAVQKRVLRALEKLRASFAKQGVTHTAQAIAGTVTQNAVLLAPVGLAAKVSLIAAKGTLVTTTIAALVNGTLKAMAWAKMKMSATISLGVLLVAGTASLTVGEWVLKLDDQHPGPVNDRAIAAVQEIGTNGLPEIIRMLSSNDPRHAVLACYHLGPKAKPAIPALIKILNSGYTRGYVGAALGRIGSDSVLPLIASLTNKDSSVRTEIVVTLGNMPVYSGKSDVLISNGIPVLIERLNDESLYVRSFAARSLGILGEKESSVIPALIHTLTDTNDEVRYLTCLALGEFAMRAKSAAPSLLTALHDDKENVRSTAAIALVQIEPDNEAQINSLMPFLNENLKGLGVTDTHFRYETAMVLGACGKKAKQAVPAMLEAIQNTSGYERQSIMTALKKINPTAAAIIHLKLFVRSFFGWS